MCECVHGRRISVVKELVKAFYSSDKMSAVMNALPLALAVIAGLHSRQFLNFEERGEAEMRPVTSHSPNTHDENKNV